MGNSKIIFGNETLIDLTSDTVVASKLLTGYTAHGADGEAITGTCDFDADTSDATATAAEILIGKTAYKDGSKLTGTMPNKGSVEGVISTKSGTYTVPLGYHDGGGSVGIDSTEQAKLIPGNIKDGVQILGVTGTYTGEGVTAQAKEVTPYTTQQTILPDSGYDYLSQVVVKAISKVVTPNAAGGNTVTIGDVAPAV